VSASRWRTIVQLSPAGRQITRHALRPISAAHGERIAAGSSSVGVLEARQRLGREVGAFTVW
jgi:hypothetical protein